MSEFASSYFGQILTCIVTLAIVVQNKLHSLTACICVRLGVTLRAPRLGLLAQLVGAIIPIWLFGWLAQLTGYQPYGLQPWRRRPLMVDILTRSSRLAFLVMSRSCKQTPRTRQLSNRKATVPTPKGYRPKGQVAYIWNLTSQGIACCMKR